MSFNLKEYRRKYYQEHKEEIKARARKDYHEHKESRKAQRKLWYNEHREESIAKASIRNKNNPNRTKIVRKSHLKQVFKMTPEEF
jgi:hypothetical protein